MNPESQVESSAENIGSYFVSRIAAQSTFSQRTPICGSLAMVSTMVPSIVVGVSRMGVDHHFACGRPGKRHFLVAVMSQIHHQRLLRILLVMI